jgi:hypothetical protein
MTLNQQAYEVKADSLVYDGSHPLDGDVYEVDVPGNAAGVIVKGQVIDIKDGGYEIHKSGGTPAAVAAEDTDYEGTEGKIPVEVYTHGALRWSMIVADPELTDTDLETLREKGIVLK